MWNSKDLSVMQPTRIWHFNGRNKLRQKLSPDWILIGTYIQDGCERFECCALRNLFLSAMNFPWWAAASLFAHWGSVTAAQQINKIFAAIAKFIIPRLVLCDTSDERRVPGSMRGQEAKRGLVLCANCSKFKLTFKNQNNCSGFCLLSGAFI